MLKFNGEEINIFKTVEQNTNNKNIRSFCTVKRDIFNRAANEEAEL